MQKRHLVVGLVMLLASGVSYELVYSTEASPAVAEAVESAAPAVGMTTAVSPLIAPPDVVGLISAFDAMPDAAVLMVSGAALLAIAAGMRRRAC